METRGHARAVAATAGWDRLRTVVIVAVMMLVAGALAVFPANAEGESDVTFTIAPGELFVSAPSSVNLGEIAATEDLLGGHSATVEWSEGDAVTVTDQRGDFLAAWDATVVGTDFTHTDPVGDTPEDAEIIPATDITYDPGADAILDTALDLAVVTTSSATLDTESTVVSVAGAAGSNQVTWTPELTIVISEDQRAGTYEGTITHSVS